MADEDPTTGELLITADEYDAPKGARVTFMVRPDGYARATAWTWPSAPR